MQQQQDEEAVAQQQQQRVDGVASLRTVLPAPVASPTVLHRPAHEHGVADFSEPMAAAPVAKICQICHIPGALLPEDGSHAPVARGDAVWLSAAATRQAALEFQQLFCPDAPLVTVRLLIMAYLSNNLCVYAFGSRCPLSAAAWDFLRSLLRTYVCHNARRPPCLRQLAKSLTTGFQTTLKVFSPVEIYPSFFDSILTENDPRADAKLYGTDTIVCYGTDTPATASAIVHTIGGITLGQNCLVASRRQMCAHVAPLVSAAMHSSGMTACYLFAPVWTWLLLHGDDDTRCLAEHIKMLATGDGYTANSESASTGAASASTGATTAGAQAGYDIALRAKSRRNWLKFCLLVMFIEQHKHWLGISGEIDAWPWLVWFALTPRTTDKHRPFEVNTDAALRSCAFSGVLTKLTTTHRPPLANVSSSVARVNTDKTEQFFDHLFCAPIADWLGVTSASSDDNRQQQQQLLGAAQPLFGSAEYAEATQQQQQQRPFGSAPSTEVPSVTPPSSFSVNQTRAFHLARTLLSVKRRFRVTEQNCGDPGTLALKLVNKVDPRGNVYPDVNRLRRGARCVCQTSRYARLPASDERLNTWYERGLRCPGTCSINEPWRTQRSSFRYEHREKEVPRRRAADLSGLRVPLVAELGRAAHTSGEPAMVLPICLWRALIKAEIRHHACDGEGSPIAIAAAKLMDYPPVASATGLGSGVCFTGDYFPEFPLYETVDGSTVLFSNVLPVHDNLYMAQVAALCDVTDADNSAAVNGTGTADGDNAVDGNDGGNGRGEFPNVDNLDEVDLRICDIPSVVVCLHESDKVPFDPRGATEALTVDPTDAHMVASVRKILEAERFKMERYDISHGSGVYQQ